MLTTASITFSATSAMFSGPRAAAGVVNDGQSDRRRGKIAKAGRRTVSRKRVSRRAMDVKSPGKRVASDSAPVLDGESRAFRPINSD